MRKILLFLILGIAAMFFTTSSGFALDLQYHQVYKLKADMNVDDIMQTQYFVQYTKFADDYQSAGYVYLIEKSGAQRKRTFLRQRIILGREEDDIDYKDTTQFTGPTSVKGLGILSWTYKAYGRDPDQWLWLPSLKKIRKISASQGDDSFLGSDFTSEEITTRRFEDEVYTLLREEKFAGYTSDFDGKSYFKDADCYVVEARPQRSPWYYSKRMIWIDKETGGDVYQEIYDETERKYKTILKNYVIMKVGGQDYSTQTLLECKNLRTGHSTVIEMKDIKFDQGLEEGQFSERMLRRSKW